jgi:hypothetical protein
VSAHEQHGQTVQLSIWANRVGMVCLILGLVLLALFVVMR